jgi:hypothetical protein
VKAQTPSAPPVGSSIKPSPAPSSISVTGSQEQGGAGLAIAAMVAALISVAVQILGLMDMI